MRESQFNELSFAEYCEVESNFYYIYCCGKFHKLSSPLCASKISSSGHSSVIPVECSCQSL